MKLQANLVDLEGVECGRPKSWCGPVTERTTSAILRRQERGGYKDAIEAIVARLQLKPW